MRHHQICRTFRLDIFSIFKRSIMLYQNRDNLIQKLPGCIAHSKKNTSGFTPKSLNLLEKVTATSAANVRSKNVGGRGTDTREDQTIVAHVEAGVMCAHLLVFTVIVRIIVFITLNPVQIFVRHRISTSTYICIVTVQQYMVGFF